TSAIVSEPPIPSLHPHIIPPFSYPPSPAPPTPHSFPTRRSSDLGGRLARRRQPDQVPAECSGVRSRRRQVRPTPAPDRARRAARSEEHTSELQSPCNLVCRLLLEKKKTTAENMHV